MRSGTVTRRANSSSQVNASIWKRVAVSCPERRARVGAPSFRRYHIPVLPRLSTCPSRSCRNENSLASSHSARTCSAPSSCISAQGFLSNNSTSTSSVDDAEVTLVRLIHLCQRLDVVSFISLLLVSQSASFRIRSRLASCCTSWNACSIPMIFDKTVSSGACIDHCVSHAARRFSISFTSSSMMFSSACH